MVSLAEFRAAALLVVCLVVGGPGFAAPGMQTRSAALAKATAAKVSPLLQGQLKELLLQSRFAELDAALESLRADFVAHGDPAEMALITGYKTFVSDPEILSRIQDWLRAEPESYQARTAHAYCLMDMAVVARGGDWTSRTPAARLEQMQAYFDDAAKEARMALRIQPKSTAPWRVLVIRARHVGDFARASTEALEAFPASYSLRVNVIVGLLPRWQGQPGDYLSIEKFAKAAQEYAGENPHLKVLLGYPHWARGADLESAGDHVGAVEELTQALKFGEEPDFYESRSISARRAHDFATAFADARRYAELAPALEAGTHLFASTLEAARRWAKEQSGANEPEGALITLSTILKFVPGDATALRNRGSLNCKAEHYSAGVRDYETILASSPDDWATLAQLVACEMGGGRRIEGLTRMAGYLAKASGNPDARWEMGARLETAAPAEAALHFQVACALQFGDSCERLAALKQGLGDSEWPGVLKDWEIHPQERLASLGDYEAFVKAIEGSPDYSGPQPSQVKFIRQPDAVYPAWLAPRVKTASVDLLLYFNADGSVAAAIPEVSVPSAAFGLAATASALRWKIEPPGHGFKMVRKIKFVMPAQSPRWSPALPRQGLTPSRG